MKRQRVIIDSNAIEVLIEGQPPFTITAVELDGEIVLEIEYSGRKIIIEEGKD